MINKSGPGKIHEVILVINISQVRKGSVLQIMKTGQTPERLYNLKIVPIVNTRRVSSVGRVSTYPTEFFKRDKDY